MFKSDRMIAMDIGASKLVVAEFYSAKAGAPQLLNYGIGKLGINPENEAETPAYVVSTARQVMREHGIKPAPLYMTVSGQAVFPRYVKLPPVARDKILQIIRYEAQQNVPFPIDEVVWDYQLIGGSDDGELNVMLVAVKTENVMRLTDCMQALGLEPEIVDVAPMALYNVVRYNYPELEGCTMILDVGARSSNLIFAEGTRIFTRSIPVAGNAITQEIMKEFGVSFDEANELKLNNAFVAFGGVYAGPESETADQISKIVRNVITRLHAEVNRSINFYRSQQGGGPPLRVLLAGGSSIIPYTDSFFREKLKVDVEYLNPFGNLAVSDRLDSEQIRKDMHLLGEVAGLALRRALTCPIEINLMPPDLVARKTFRKRQPFLVLAAAGLVLITACWWVYANRMKALSDSQLEKVERKIAGLRGVHDALNDVLKEKTEANRNVEALMDVIGLRTRWVEIMDAIHSSMLDGMWLTAIEPVKEDGQITQIIIKGKGFEDKLKLMAKPNATPIEVFRDRLRNSEHFSMESQITGQPLPDAGAYSREFTICLTLERPIPAGGATGG